VTTWSTMVDRVHLRRPREPLSAGEDWAMLLVIHGPTESAADPAALDCLVAAACRPLQYGNLTDVVIRRMDESTVLILLGKRAVLIATKLAEVTRLVNPTWRIGLRSGRVRNLDPPLATRHGRRSLIRAVARPRC
jgi:hypothetical protein